MALEDADLTAAVRSSFAGADDARARELADAAVRHLHAFASEVGLTREEWRAGIDFLTAIGHITSDTRQEFILLSDVLGLSSLVESRGGEGTEHTVLGPFYVPGSPLRPLGASILVDDDPGERVSISGRVLSSQDGAPLRAQLDVWQNATNRLYAVQDPRQSPDNLRGRFETGADGRFRFGTVRPVPYPIPDDGPVGRLLAATGRHPWRPAHIHFIVRADGCRPLVTHVFDAASDYLESDAVFGARDSLITSFEGGQASFDFVLEPMAASTGRGPSPPSRR